MTGPSPTASGSQADELLAPLRRIAFSVSASLPALLLVLWFALDGQVTGGVDDPLPWLLVGIAVVWAVGGNRFAHQQVLRAPDLDSFIGQYRTSFFIGLATAETPALLGFVAAFVIEAAWPFLVGLLPALLGMWAIAPTPERLRSYDRAFRSRGVDVKPSDLLQRRSPEPL